MYAERIHSPQQSCGIVCRRERKRLQDKRALGVQGILMRVVWIQSRLWRRSEHREAAAERIRKSRAKTTA